MLLKIALAQIPVTTDITANTAAVIRGVEFAHKENADILLTPEGSLSGYTKDFDNELFAEALDKVTSLAKEYSVGLALGTCFKEPDGKSYNQQQYYDAGGNFFGAHCKILLCCDPENINEGEMNEFSSASLVTRTFKGVTTGGLICNDMWANPGYTPSDDVHLSRQLAKMGAKIIFHSVNGGRDGSEWSREVIFSYHETNLRMRAAADKIFIASVDNCYPVDMQCSSQSGIVGPDGNWICKTVPQGEQFIAHTVKI